MELIDLTVETRGFAPRSIALSLRTAATCHGMRYRPDCRIVCGIGLLAVEPADDGGYRFEDTGRYLGGEDTPVDLLDWLEAQIAPGAAIISWHNWGSVPRRLAAIADAQRHPAILAAAGDARGRWRDLPYGDTWYLRQARSLPVPCICPSGQQVADCQATVPLALLPDSEIAVPQLIAEAGAGWRAWAQIFAGLDGEMPAIRALRDFEAWRAATSITRRD